MRALVSLVVGAALGAVGCGAPAAAPVVSEAPPAVASGASAPAAASGPAWTREIALHLRQPQTLPGGLGVSLQRFEIEEVAADPHSGAPAYGLLVAKLELSDGGRKEIVEIVSPVGQAAAKTVQFGSYRVAYAASSAEHSRDPVVVVRVERIVP